MSDEVLPERRIPTPDERAFVRRILWIAWGLSFALGAAAPLARGFTGIRRIELLPIWLAVMLMIGANLLVRKKTLGNPIAISMSISGIVVGGSAGFLAWNIFHPRPSGYLIGATWSLFSIPLVMLFLKELRREEEWVLQAEKDDQEWKEQEALLEAMSAEERRVYFDQFLETMEEEGEESNRRLKRIWIRMAVVGSLAGVLLITSWMYRAFFEK